MGIYLEAINKLNNPHIIDEDLKGWAINNYRKIFGDEVSDKEFFSKIVSIAKLDPTMNLSGSEKDDEVLKKQQGSYIAWLLRLIKKGVTYEDIMQNAHEYKDQLEIFNDLKKRNRLPSDKKDIMQLKNLEELMNMIMSLGGQSETGGHSDFKQDIANIREGLKHICRLEDRDIPQNIQKVDDVLEFLGENDKWEIWKAKNEFGTMLFDSWGNGAGWCVGGMLGNNHGAAQLSQARSYFPRYNADGNAWYVCFQQKDKNAPRPNNKYLITLGPNGSKPNNGWAGYQFNNSQNSTMRIGRDESGEQDDQMDAFAEFLQANGLTEVFKKTEFKDCACFLNIENKQRLDNGEPFRYVGGKIRDYLKDAITTIIFVDDEGKEHLVDAKKNKEYLNCESVTEMLNMENLIFGKPYIYDGSEKNVNPKFRTLVKEVIIPDTYNREVSWTGSSFVGIPFGAFMGCVNMTKCTFPVSVVVLQNNCFRVNGRDAPYTDIELYTPRHRIKCAEGDDVEFLKKHLHYIGEVNNIPTETKQEEPKEEEK